MKLQPDKFDVQSITGYGPGWVTVNGEKIAHAVLISSRGERIDWNCAGFDALGPQHFGQLAAMDAELVVFGSGLRLRFPQPAWLKPLYARRIGLETMDTRAACRTYNILAQEGRNVVAALLMEETMG